MFDELTGNLHVCAKNGGEKGREVEGGREGGRSELGRGRKGREK